MKKIAIAAALLMTTSALFAATKSNSDTSYLFVQNAKHATLSAVKGQANTYTLTLLDANPFVSYFSDRPNRVTGLMSVTDYIQKYWQTGSNSFAKDQPNASLEGVNVHLLGKDNVSDYTVELSNPVYNAKADSMTYTIHALNGSNALPNNASFDYSAVFIDNYCMGCVHASANRHNVKKSINNNSKSGN